MLQDLAAVDTHPLAATAARYVGLLPLLPLAGFLVNGALSLATASGAEGMSNSIISHSDPWVRPTSNVRASACRKNC